MKNIIYMQIAIIGAGNVGGTLANILYRDNKVQKIVLLDSKEDFVQGRVLDIMHSGSSDIILHGTAEYKDIKNSDIVITCAGKKRTDDMTREDLLNINKEIIVNAAKQISRFAPEAFNIIVTNPVDILTYEFYKASKSTKNKIIGMAGVLDSNRFKYLLSKELNCSIHDISTFVIGEHGNNMIPLIQYTTINNISLMDLIENNQISGMKVKKIISQVQSSGLEIIKLQQMSAFYSTAASIATMIYAFMDDKYTAMTGSAICNGAYNVSDVAIGMPIKINKDGVKIVDYLNLTTEQQNILSATVDKMKKL